MTRFIAALATSVALLAFAAPSYAASPAPMASGMSSMSSSSMKTSTTCPKGETWVKPYTKADGTKVKGYCRKSSSMSSSSMSKPAAMASPAK